MDVDLFLIPDAQDTFFFFSSAHRDVKKQKMAFPHFLSDAECTGEKPTGSHHILGLELLTELMSLFASGWPSSVPPTTVGLDVFLK